MKTKDAYYLSLDPNSYASVEEFCKVHPEIGTERTVYRMRARLIKMGKLKPLPRGKHKATPHKRALCYSTTFINKFEYVLAK